MAQNANKLVATEDPKIPSQVVSTKGAQFPYVISHGQPDPFFGQQFHPFLWEKGLMTDLGTLGGSDGFTTGINKVGQAVGGANVNDTVVPPFTFPPFFALPGKTA